MAYYRHSAQDRQENSIPIQGELVGKWAREHNIEIIHEFADHGKSGLSTEHRDAFNDMMENWVKKKNDFQYVLVLDVSRWGRFQDIDLSAAYSADCTKQGKQVVYTTFGVPKDDDPLYPLYVQMERYRAARYSRELSDKVFSGCKKIAEQGFRAGSSPPYGLHRLLLNEARRPVQVLKPRERKSIQNQRVTLTPGDPDEVAVVRRVFEEFAHGGRGEPEIAHGLNRDRIPSPGGVLWNAAMVRHILTNESYVGTIVYNKTKSRLMARLTRNPRKEWVRTPNAFKGILPQNLYDQAQAVYEQRTARQSAAYLLDQLAKIYEARGVVTPGLIKAVPRGPSLFAYQKHFRCLGAAFQRVFQNVHGNVIQDVRAKLKRVVSHIEDHADFIVLDNRLTVLVQPSVPVPNGFESYWVFRPDRRPVVDLTLGVLLSDTQRYEILGYLALPRLLVRGDVVRVASPGDGRIELFGHNGLDFIQDMLNEGGANGESHPS